MTYKIEICEKNKIKFKWKSIKIDKKLCEISLKFKELFKFNDNDNDDYWFELLMIDIIPYYTVYDNLKASNITMKKN